MNDYSSFHGLEELRNDRDIALEAVRQGGWALQHASAELQKGPKIQEGMLKVNRNGLADHTTSSFLRLRDSLRN